MQVTHKIEIHLDDKRLVPPIDAVQGDAYTRKLEFSLYSGGEKWPVPDSVSVAVGYSGAAGRGLYDTLPDGSKAYMTAGNVVTITLIPQVVAMHGRTIVTIVFTDSTGKQLATFGVEVRVAPNPAVGAGEPADYYNLREWASTALKLNIDREDDGSWSTDKDYDTILQEHSAGREIGCNLEMSDETRLYVPFARWDGKALAFSTVYDGKEWRVEISRGDDGGTAVEVVSDAYGVDCLPEYSEADNGKVLGIVDGNPAWVKASVGGGGDTPIIPGSHGIVWDLVNVTSSNAAVSVADGASLVAVLTAAEGYTLGDVTVTMGGEVLTGVWNADTSTVVIASVTGDVVISCTASQGVDTSPIIAQENVGYSSDKTINDFSGVGITKVYGLAYDVEEIKTKTWYDAENGYTTFAGALGIIVIYTPHTKMAEAGYTLTSITTKASKIALMKGDTIFHTFSNSSLTSDTPAEHSVQMPRKNADVLYASGVSFSISLLDAEDSYAYWKGMNESSGNDPFVLPVGVRSGDIIFAGKNTPYYGMANIDGTLPGQSVVASELSLDDDIAKNYAVATTSVLGDEPAADANTAYGISNSFAEVITTAKKEWMTAYGGDYRKIPIIVSTDQHGRRNEGIFTLLGKTVNMHDVSKVMNLGDTVSTWYDADPTKPLLTDAGLDAWLGSIKAIPYSKRLDVYGNHDTWYGNYQDEGNPVGTRYPSSQAHLNQYFRNIYARRTNNNGWFVVHDDQFNVKYVVVSAFEYKDGVTFRIGTEQMKFIIDEFTKNDGYDIVVVSHVPLYMNPELNSYPTGQTSTGTHRTSELDTDAFFSARKTKGIGTITDSDGVEHSYDFTTCKSDLLCSLHGHTHYDAYLYLNDSLLVNAFDWFDDNTFFFVLIDRANRLLNVWKVEAPDNVPTYQNYQIPLDKPTE